MGFTTHFLAGHECSRSGYGHGLGTYFTTAREKDIYRTPSRAEEGLGAVKGSRRKWTKRRANFWCGMISTLGTRRALDETIYEKASIQIYIYIFQHITMIVLLGVGDNNTTISHEIVSPIP